ncbi:MAG TPA: DUF2207 domain-containing protein, partial [Allosphingosinicella sp.]|nr:DUF2207 domain-containing protein [Allosphingosinicella sp.]
MKTVRTLIALLLAALAFAAPASGKPEAIDVFDPPEPPAYGERILSFSSDIAVGRDSALTVTETIRIRAEGNRFQHGLLREFPTRYQRDGRTVRVGFHVEQIQRDGHDEPWTSEGMDNGERLRIGSADTYIPQGEHTYTIRY